MLKLLTLMHRAKIQIVAGTDGSGIELIRELEIYVKADLGYWSDSCRSSAFSRAA